jgi:hypothetical protein
VYLNAGLMARPPSEPLHDPVATLTESTYRKVTSVNVDGVVLGIIESLPHLEARGGGDILVTASMAGLVPFLPDPLYALSKHALVGLVRSLGPSLVSRSIRLNAICPGGIDTAIVPDQLRPQVNLSPPSYIADVVVASTGSPSFVVTRDLVKPKRGETWLLVTSAWHMPRSVGIFRRLGFDVIPYPVAYRTFSDARDFLLPTPMIDKVIMLDNSVREWVGLLAYRLAGKTDALFPAP